MIKAIGNVGFAVAILLCLVGLLSAATRTVNTVRFLTDPEFVIDTANQPPGAAGFDARYYDHPYLTLVHTIPGVLFMTLGPVQFIAGIRNRFLRFHRWSGRVFVLASLVVQSRRCCSSGGCRCLAVFPPAWAWCSPAWCFWFAWCRAIEPRGGGSFWRIASG